MSAPLALREPPHSVEIERAVLAVCLDGRHAAAVPTAREALTALSWHLHHHRLVWLAVEDLDDAGQRVDMMTVAQLMAETDIMAARERLRAIEEAAAGDGLTPARRAEIRARYRRADDAQPVDMDASALGAVGGFNGITDLAGAYAPVAGLARNVALIADYAAKRRLIAELTRLTDEAHKTRRTAAEIAGDAADVACRVEGARVDRTLGDAGASLLAEHDRIAARPDDERVARWGVGALDRAMPLRRGLTVLAAPPGTGKTSLALEAEEATTAALGPGACAYLSLEMDAEQLAAVRIARALGIGRDLIERGRLSPSQRQRAGEIAEAMRAEATRVKDGVGDHTVRGVAAWVRRVRQRTPALALVIVDHLQLMDGTSARQTEYARLSEATAALKRLQREMGISILCLSQMNRAGQRTGQGEDRRQPVPQLSDLRGSGTIEQDADNVIALQKPCEDGSGGSCAIVAHVLKHRGGAIGEAHLTWHRARGQRFVGQEPPAPDASRRERMTSEPSSREDVF